MNLHVKLCQCEARAKYSRKYESSTRHSSAPTRYEYILRVHTRCDSLCSSRVPVLLRSLRGRGGGGDECSAKSLWVRVCDGRSPQVADGLPLALAAARSANSSASRSARSRTASRRVACSSSCGRSNSSGSPSAARVTASSCSSDSTSISGAGFGCFWFWRWCSWWPAPEPRRELECCCCCCRVLRVFSSSPLAIQYMWRSIIRIPERNRYTIQILSTSIL